MIDVPDHVPPRWRTRRATPALNGTRAGRSQWPPRWSAAPAGGGQGEQDPGHPRRGRPGEGARGLPGDPPGSLPPPRPRPPRHSPVRRRPWPGAVGGPGQVPDRAALHPSGTPGPGAGGSAGARPAPHLRHLGPGRPVPTWSSCRRCWATPRWTPPGATSTPRPRGSARWSGATPVRWRSESIFGEADLSSRSGSGAAWPRTGDRNSRPRRLRAHRRQCDPLLPRPSASTAILSGGLCPNADDCAARWPCWRTRVAALPRVRRL